LNAAERALFKELIANTHPRAFVASDMWLIVSYVQATLMARQTARDPEQNAVWERSVKLQAILATKLRLAPQSRLDRKTVGRHASYRATVDPWDLKP
jgi:hypothetical protein